MGQTIELQVVQAFTGLLALAVTLAVGYLSPRVKKWLSIHTTAKTASVAGSVIDGLSTVAQSVVADFNQRVVADAKSNGVWNAQLAQQVKKDAVQAVMSQGANLVSLAGQTVGDVQGLVSSFIERAVAGGKTASLISATATVAQSPTPSSTVQPQPIVQTPQPAVS